jgi:uncharacterized protein
VTNATHPTFRDLAPSEVDVLLARNHVGRMAYSFRDRVDIEPISYVYADGVFYFRTALGSKVATLAHAPWVAFEVDEVSGLFDWRSAVAHGTVYVLEDAGSPSARASYRIAVEHLRSLTSQALNADDPTPERTIVLRMQPASVTGREAHSSVSQTGGGKP